MKRLISCLAVLFVVTSCCLYGQDFKAGIIAGVVPSQVDGDDMSGFNKIGFTGGAYASKSLNNNWFLQSEITYTMKGSRVASSKNTDFSKRELTTNYIDLGLYCGYYIMDNLYLKLGLIPSVLIYHKEQTPGGISVDESSVAGFRPFNLLASAGIGYFLTKHFLVGLTYNYSVFSLRKGSVEIFDYDIKEANAQFHNYMTLTLAYQF